MPFTPWGAKEVSLAALVFATAAVVCAALFRAYHSWWLFAPLIPLGALSGWVLWFFRDPPRAVPDAPGVIVSPADGTVTHLDMAEEPDYIGGAARRCSIFLSIFNVHLNRSPARGTVEFVRFRPGEFLDARLEESLAKNQNQDVGIACGEEGYPSRMLVRQSTGAIARRIVCPVEPGRELGRGEVYGMIKFGSRTTLYVSPDAEISWQVKVGDAVQAGRTVLATVTARNPDTDKAARP